MKSIFEKLIIKLKNAKEFFKKFFFITAVEHHEKIQHVVPAVSTLSRFHFAIIFALLILGGYQVFSIVEKNRKIENTGAAVQSVRLVPLRQNFYKDVVLEAKAAYVLDVTSDRVLFAKNESSALPLASLVKVMTALVADEAIPHDTIVEITPESIQEEGDTGLFVGERWKLQNLMDFTLGVSSNDGASAIARAVSLNLASGESGDLSSFVESMNTTAMEIGMKNTRFNNVTGLDENDHEAGAYGTAEDLAKLFSFIVKHRSRLLEATKYHSLEVKSLDKMHTIVNTTSSIHDIPSLIGAKTGFTDLAQGNLLVAFDGGVGYPIVIVILGSSYNGRFADAGKLAEATLSYLGGY